MTGEYWNTEPDEPSSPGRVSLRSRDVRLSLTTDTGVFARTAIDRGTRVLLDVAPTPLAGTGAIDVGCGYGPIALAMAARAPVAGVWAIDVNRRALALTAANARANDVPNVEVSEPADVPPAVRFASLFSNPPIKVGRDALDALLDRWLGRLAPGGTGWLVVKKAMGADSLHRRLLDGGRAVDRVTSRNGYRIGRFATAHDALRDAGYPIVPLLAHGRLTGGRAYLLTGFAAGAHPSALTAAHVDEALAAVELQAGVVADRTRDWSAMVTLFLNGGIASMGFDDRTVALARSVLARLPKPVPALPSGDFVHGDLSPRNLLFAPDGTLAAVIDAEGFGSGTRVIDLVSLLAFVVGTGDHELAGVIADRAREVAADDVFAACLAHRILAILQWPTEQPDLLAVALADASALIEFFG